VGYVGADALGKARSVEAELVRALKATGLLPAETASGDLAKVGWSTALPLDNPASAAAQCVVLDGQAPRAPGGLAGLADKVNNALPAEVRVLNCAPCGPDGHQHGHMAGQSPARPPSSRRFDASREAVSRVLEYLIPSAALMPMPPAVLEGGPAAVLEHMRSFRLSKKGEQGANAVLAMFHTGGTKGIPWNRASWDFSLFTDRQQQDPAKPAGANRRSVKQFRCGEKVMLGGVEHVCLRVEGNSFLPQQVPRMVGLAVLCAQARTSRPPEEVMLGALQGEGAVVVPCAPGHPLVLDRVVYSMGEKAASAPRDGWTDTYSLQQMEAFKRAVLYPHLASPAALQAFAAWLVDGLPAPQ